LKERIVAIVAEAPHLWYDDRHLSKGFEIFKATVENTDRFWNSTIREHKGSRKLAEKVVNRWQKTWVNNPAMKNFDDRQVLDHIDCPSLLIHGLKDPFFPPEHTKYIADRIAQRNVPTQYELFSDAGHTAHRETKALYNTTVLSFLRKYQPLLMKAIK
jgi:pimeloyl-ACP methyl ester carboxylesterase